MICTERPLPDTKSLERDLSTILARDGRRISIVERQQNSYSSTARTEFLAARFPEGEHIQIFCKYLRLRARRDEDWEFDPHYETKVYTKVLAGAPVTTPRYYGTWTEPAGAGGALLLESLSGVPRVNKTSDVPASMEAAATWLGVFHSHFEQALGLPRLDFLKRLDSDYYERRVAQMRAANAELLTAHPWLSRILAGFHAIVEPLLATSLTIVHGEYYPDNILVRDAAVLPIDWETAAVGAGECDLATLTEGWPERISVACTDAYVRARWPDSVRTDFATRLLCARLSTHIHRLGWKLDKGEMWRLVELRRLAGEFGLV